MIIKTCIVYQTISINLIEWAWAFLEFSNFCTFLNFNHQLRCSSVCDCSCVLYDTLINLFSWLFMSCKKGPHVMTTVPLLWKVIRETFSTWWSVNGSCHSGDKATLLNWEWPFSTIWRWYTTLVTIEHDLICIGKFKFILKTNLELKSIYHLRE